ncbi:hypothetical protein BLNAU_12544 [Blattamonas nauphoetae]|uniref:Uncharacterized protein n=1 Tax=Blattamonas nauphoetae TaxID=2049346 RepID=A0ABQ9XJ23_9EUKA|nr:hypothetical protein BLNAU_12544 [Blattamonas nauphoetae]
MKDGQTFPMQGVLKHSTTKVACEKNIEKALAYLWKQSPKVNRMPRASDVFEKKNQSVVVDLLRVMFDVFISRQIRSRHKTIFSWFNTLLGNFGLSIPLDVIKPGNTQERWQYFRTGTILGLICIAFLEGRTKPLASGASPESLQNQFFFHPENEDEILFNVRQSFLGLKELGVPLFFKPEVFIRTNSPSFLMFQLDVIFKELHTESPSERVVHEGKNTAVQKKYQSEWMNERAMVADWIQFKDDSRLTPLDSPLAQSPTSATDNELTQVSSDSDITPRHFTPLPSVSPPFSNPFTSKSSLSSSSDVSSPIIYSTWSKGPIPPFKGIGAPLTSIPSVSQSDSSKLTLVSRSFSNSTTNSPDSSPSSTSSDAPTPEQLVLIPESRTASISRLNHPSGSFDSFDQLVRSGFSPEDLNRPPHQPVSSVDVRPRSTTNSTEKTNNGASSFQTAFLLSQSPLPPENTNALASETSSQSSKSSHTDSDATSQPTVIPAQVTAAVSLPSFPSLSDTTPEPSPNQQSVLPTHQSTNTTQSFPTTLPPHEEPTITAPTPEQLLSPSLSVPLFFSLRDCEPSEQFSSTIHNISSNSRCVVSTTPPTLQPTHRTPPRPTPHSTLSPVGASSSPYAHPHRADFPPLPPSISSDHSPIHVTQSMLSFSSVAPSVSTSTCGTNLDIERSVTHTLDFSAWASPANPPTHDTLANTSPNTSDVNSISLQSPAQFVHLPLTLHAGDSVMEVTLPVSPTFLSERPSPPVPNGKRPEPSYAFLTTSSLKSITSRLGNYSPFDSRSTSPLSPLQPRNVQHTHQITPSTPQEDTPTSYSLSVPGRLKYRRRLSGRVGSRGSIGVVQAPSPDAVQTHFALESDVTSQLSFLLTSPPKKKVGLRIEVDTGVWPGRGQNDSDKSNSLSPFGGHSHLTTPTSHHPPRYPMLNQSAHSRTAPTTPIETFDNSQSGGPSSTLSLEIPLTPSRQEEQKKVMRIVEYQTLTPTSIKDVVFTEPTDPDRNGSSLGDKKREYASPQPMRTNSIPFIRNRIQSLPSHMPGSAITIGQVMNMKSELDFPNDDQQEEDDDSLPGTPAEHRTTLQFSSPALKDYMDLLLQEHPSPLTSTSDQHSPRFDPTRILTQHVSSITKVDSAWTSPALSRKSMGNTPQGERDRSSMMDSYDDLKEVASENEDMDLFFNQGLTSSEVLTTHISDDIELSPPRTSERKKITFEDFTKDVKDLAEEGEHELEEDAGTIEEGKEEEDEQQDEEEEAEECRHQNGEGEKREEDAGEEDEPTLEGDAGTSEDEEGGDDKSPVSDRVSGDVDEVEKQSHTIDGEDLSEMTPEEEHDEAEDARRSEDVGDENKEHLNDSESGNEEQEERETSRNENGPKEDETQPVMAEEEEEQCGEQEDKLMAHPDSTSTQNETELDKVTENNGHSNHPDQSQNDQKEEDEERYKKEQEEQRRREEKRMIKERTEEEARLKREEEERMREEEERRQKEEERISGEKAEEEERLRKDEEERKRQEEEDMVAQEKREEEERIRKEEEERIEKEEEDRVKMEVERISREQTAVSHSNPQNNQTQNDAGEERDDDQPEGQPDDGDDHDEPDDGQDEANEEQPEQDGGQDSGDDDKADDAADDGNDGEGDGDGDKDGSDDEDSHKDTDSDDESEEKDGDDDESEDESDSSISAEAELSPEDDDNIPLTPDHVEIPVPTRPGILVHPLHYQHTQSLTLGASDPPQFSSTPPPNPTADTLSVSPPAINSQRFFGRHRGFATTRTVASFPLRLNTESPTTEPTSDSVKPVPNVPHLTDAMSFLSPIDSSHAHSADVNSIAANRWSESSVRYWDTIGQSGSSSVIETDSGVSVRSVSLDLMRENAGVGWLESVPGVQFKPFYVEELSMNTPMGLMGSRRVSEAMPVSARAGWGTLKRNDEVPLSDLLETSSLKFSDPPRNGSRQGEVVGRRQNRVGLRERERDFTRRELHQRSHSVMGMMATEDSDDEDEGRLRRRRRNHRNTPLSKFRPSASVDMASIGADGPLVETSDSNMALDDRNTPIGEESVGEGDLVSECAQSVNGVEEGRVVLEKLKKESRGVRKRKIEGERRSTEVDEQKRTASNAEDVIGRA